MFFNKKLDLSNFKTNKVKDMFCMFSECSSLEELNISNFEFSDSIDVEGMFSFCPENLRNQMKIQFPNIKDNAYNYRPF